MRLAGGGALAFREAARMVSEKIETAIEAQVAATAALVAGDPEAALDRAASAYRRRVTANRRRLARS